MGTKLANTIIFKRMRLQNAEALIPMGYGSHEWPVVKFRRDISAYRLRRQLLQRFDRPHTHPGFGFGLDAFGTSW